MTAGRVLLAWFLLVAAASGAFTLALISNRHPWWSRPIGQLPH